MCKLVRASITKLCAFDHNNDDAKLSHWLENKTVRNFRSWIEQNRSFCAFDENRRMIGVSFLSSKNEILLNYVSPEHYRSGVGKRLLEEIETSVTKPCVLKVCSTKTALGF